MWVEEKLIYANPSTSDVLEMNRFPPGLCKTVALDIHLLFLTVG